MKRRDLFRGALGLTLMRASVTARGHETSSEGALGLPRTDASTRASRTTSATERARRVQGMTPEELRRSRFVNVVLKTHEGKAVRFYDDLLKDKAVLINFIYTRCTDDCPLATAKLARVQRILGERVGRDIFMYSITVDPQHDTPAVLLKYARTFDVKPGWLFLTGETDDIQRIRGNFGDDPTLGFRQSDHLNLIAYGIEPLERWGKCPTLIDPEWIARYLLWLDPKGERPTGWWPPGRGVSEEQNCVGS